MNGGIVFLLILIILTLGGYAAWVIWSRTQAQKLGLPPPSLNPFSKSSSSAAAASNYPGPAPVGIKGWIDAQIYKFKNRNNRYATGAYEESSAGAGAAGYAGAARGGRGAGSRLDPDEAWDARVGHEAYYEEQELGLQDPAQARLGAHQSANPFETTPYGAPSPGFGAEPERGRSRNREYDDAVESRGLQNPFGDDHAASLRGVSPRPLDHGVDTSYGGASSAHAPTSSTQQHQQKKDGNSPTESRRSLFKEDI